MVEIVERLPQQHVINDKQLLRCQGRQVGSTGLAPAQQVGGQAGGQHAGMLVGAGMLSAETCGAWPGCPPTSLSHVAPSRQLLPPRQHQMQAQQ